MANQHQIFISSQMDPDTLKQERATVRKVIEKKFPHFRAWDWDKDGCAGEKPPMEKCLTEVERSYALVLIVSQTLTDHTRMEYEKASDIGLFRFIFFKKGRQRGKAYEFRKLLSREGAPSWKEYQNIHELESRLFNSLRDHCYEALSAYEPSIGTKTGPLEVRE